ncbi:MAG: DUF2182 domain-containing protein [Shinella sp.]|nr:DUF2182 domain-containing protein [Shinella sp.]
MRWSYPAAGAGMLLRDGDGLLAAIILLLLVLSAWLLLFAMAGQTGPFSGFLFSSETWQSLCMTPAGGLSWAVAGSAGIMGAAMAVAMMLPCALPAWQHLRRGGEWQRACAFIAGYAAVWIAISAIAAAAEIAAKQAFAIDPGAAAAVLAVLAGVYQFSRAKTGAMAHMRCETVAEAGTGGMLRGMHYARHCVRSNGPAMALMLATGMTDMRVMIGLCAGMLLEKIAPRPLTARLVGAALLGTGAAWAYGAFAA